MCWSSSAATIPPCAREHGCLWRTQHPLLLLRSTSWVVFLIVLDLEACNGRSFIRSSRSTPRQTQACVRAQCLGRRVMESQVPSAIPGDEVRVVASGVSHIISRDWAEFHGPGRFQISRSKPQHGGMD
ncbi:hypothetical protein BKA56DRAFT_659312 [Ilyonectria sp. MPI-CAGE-AT-0026]|nr:hypothetical protein BKA56DRAFT_659312 [Ilyonectria sp. MPI-CAGE-AT-0026]